MEVVGTLSDAACVSSTHLYDLCVVKGVPLFFGDQYFILDKKQQQQKKVAKKRGFTHTVYCAGVFLTSSLIVIFFIVKICIASHKEWIAMVKQTNKLAVVLKKKKGQDGI